jgi:hypothetical protein
MKYPPGKKKSLAHQILKDKSGYFARRENEIAKARARNFTLQVE